MAQRPGGAAPEAPSDAGSDAEGPLAPLAPRQLLPPDSWVWPLCVPLELPAGPEQGGAGAPGGARVRMSIHGLGGPGQLQLVLLSGDGDMIWDEVVDADAAGTASFRLPRPREPGVLWLLGFCPEGYAGPAALGGPAPADLSEGSGGSFFSADSFWGDQQQGVTPAGQPVGEAPAHAGGSSGSSGARSIAPAAAGAGAGSGAGGASGCPVRGARAGQLVLSVPLLVAEQPVAAEAARLLGHMLKGRQSVEFEERREKARREQEQAQLLQRQRQAPQAGSPPPAAASPGARLGPTTPGATGDTEEGAARRRRQPATTESEEVLTDQLHAEWLQSRSQRYMGELPTAPPPMRSSGAWSRDSGGSGRGSGAPAAAEGAGAGGGGAAAAAPGRAGPQPGGLSAAQLEERFAAALPRLAGVAPGTPADVAAALAEPPEGRARAAQVMHRASPRLRMGSGEFGANTVHAVIDRHWVPLAADMELVLRAGAAPNTPVVAGDAARARLAGGGARLRAPELLALAQYMMEWLGERGYLECCAMLCNALQAQGVQLLYRGEPLALGAPPLTAQGLIAAAHAAPPPAPATPAPGGVGPAAGPAGLALYGAGGQGRGRGAVGAGGGGTSVGPASTASGGLSVAGGPVAGGLTAFGLPRSRWFGQQPAMPVATQLGASGAALPEASHPSYTSRGSGSRGGSSVGRRSAASLADSAAGWVRRRLLPCRRPTLREPGGGDDEAPAA